VAQTRVLVVFGTRPEAIKLFPVIAALRDDGRFIVRVCVSGQHRGILDQVLDLAGIRPDHDLGLMRPGRSLDALTGALLSGIGSVIDAERPDRVIVQGDTATAFAGALAGYNRQVPVAHVEAGLRSHDIYHPWPEEVNRKLIAAIADLHFAPTASAAASLRREGIAGDRVHCVGNTVVDALLWMRARNRSVPPVGPVAALTRRFTGRRIVAVTSHRRENLGIGLAEIAAALRRIAAREDVAIVFPLHPNPAVRAVFEPAIGGLANVALTEPLAYPQFVALLDACTLVLTDSGGVQEEAPAFGKPVLVMRETTERPEGIAAGTAKLVGVDADRIARKTFRLLDDPEAYAAMARAHQPFGDGHAARRIVEVLGAQNEKVGKSAPAPVERSDPGVPLIAGGILPEPALTAINAGQ
jgi:UDP-N-acetylglucosamine 2-epimerase (non-hydrolysing)